MSIKSITVRIDEKLLEQLKTVARYECRSLSSHVRVLIREDIEQHMIHCKINPDVNVKPTRK